jgi:hypothetical protein
MQATGIGSPRFSFGSGGCFLERPTMAKEKFYFFGQELLDTFRNLSTRGGKMGTHSNLPFGWNSEQYDAYQRELHDNIRCLGRFGPSDNEYDVDRLVLTDEDRRLLADLHISV